MERTSRTCPYKSTCVREKLWPLQCVRTFWEFKLFWQNARECYMYVHIYTYSSFLSAFETLTVWMNATEWNFAAERTALHRGASKSSAVSLISERGFDVTISCSWRNIKDTNHQPVAITSSVGNVIGNSLGSVIFFLINTSLNGH